MATFEINVNGLGQLQERLTAAAGRIDVQTKDAMHAAASLVEIAVKNKLRESSHPRRTVTPSAPGSPPSLISGNLMRSIAVKGPTGAAGAYRAEIGPTAIYGRIQELGGDTGRNGATHLPPRPYMQPALDKVVADGTLAACYATAWRTAF